MNIYTALHWYIMVHLPLIVRVRACAHSLTSGNFCPEQQHQRRKFKRPRAVQTRAARLDRDSATTEKRSHGHRLADTGSINGRAPRMEPAATESGDNGGVPEGNRGEPRAQGKSPCALIHAHASH